MGSSAPLTHRLVFLVSMLALVLGTCSSARAQGTLRVLHNFGGSGDGYAPSGALALDGHGNLYGTTYHGPGGGCIGDLGCGVVFKLQPNSDGTWTESVIHYFSGVDGSNPTAGPVFGRRGDLYGTTYAGGPADYGTVFRMTLVPGGNWILSSLYSFPAVSSGIYPVSGVSFDPAGRLYGTTSIGGPYTWGIVFDLGPVTAFNWYEILTHGFGAPGDGELLYGNLIFDASGNAYGTTNMGGANNAGTVFKLTPNRLTFGWTEAVLYSFRGTCNEGPDAAEPAAGLTFDSAGNLYGTTECGGAYGLGTVFKLTHNSDGTWTESVIYSFDGGSDGANPLSSVIFDNAGSLYGTTSDGGQFTDGTIFKLTPSHGSWTETTLHTFSYSDGAFPGTVIFDSAGNLYGTTSSGGTYGQAGGVAFEFIPQ